MPLRREATYLTVETWKSCWLIAKSLAGKLDDQGLARTITADEVADTLLRDAIKEKYPQLLEHQKEVQKLERELFKTLATHSPPLTESVTATRK